MYLWLSLAGLQGSLMAKAYAADELELEKV